MAVSYKRGSPVLTRHGYLGQAKHPWRETGPPHHHDDKVDSDQEVVNNSLGQAGHIIAMIYASEYGTYKTVKARF